MICLKNKKLVNFKGIWLLLCMVFMIVLNIITPIMAAPLATTTTINSSIGAIKSGESLNFTIYVYSGYDPVIIGPIRITDTNTSQYIDGNILNGVAIIDWNPTSFIEGKHVFKAEFLGYLDYISSEGECIVHFKDYGSDPIRETSISINVNSTVAFKNSSIQITVELLVLSQWYLNGGFIYVKNLNLSGSPTIHTHGPLPNYLPGTVPVVWTFSFDYKIPVFSQVGKTCFIAEYTGSSGSHTQPCTSNPINVSIMSTGYWLDQNLNQIELQRETSILEINTTILGDYPAGLELKSFYFIDTQQIMISDQILTGRNVISTFFPNSSVTIGSLSIITELIDPYTEHQYVNSTVDITILDNARIVHTENATEYKHNDTIRFEIYVTEEDVWTHPVICDVELTDVTDGNRFIDIKTTNQAGFVVFEYSIPSNASVGAHEFLLKTNNTGNFISNVFETFFIAIKGKIEIDITFDSGGVDRGSYTTIEVTVLSGGSVVSEGNVALEFAINGTLIEMKICIPGISFDYFISLSHPLGVISYQIHFFNSINYDEYIEPFDLTIFSNPTFNVTGQNSTEIIKGQTLRVWGQIIDENGYPVTYEEINIRDTTTGTFLGTSSTSVFGVFYFDYLITHSMQIGVHFIEISYLGNFLEFYHEATNIPIISVLIRPPLSIIIDSEVVANNWTMISLEGGLSDEIFLSWQQIGDTEWFSIGSTLLNTTGQGEFNWITPDYKGDFIIRAVGPNSTKYDYSTMFAIPSIFITGASIGNVNDQYSFTINSTEKFQIWVDGQIWQNWQQSGVQSYNYYFTSRGIKDIMIISNDTYVYYNEYHQEVTIFEDLITSLNSPQETFFNLTVNLDGTVIGEVSGPLDGIDVILVINDIEVEVDSTNGAGYYSFSIVLDVPGYHNLRVRTIKTGFYSNSSSDESIIFVNSIPPNIEILSPLNQTYGSIIEIDISGNADTYWYRIAPIDSSNITWIGPTYRNLAEGNYTCIVYGQNSFGVVTIKSSSFAIDTTAPSLALLSPDNKTYTTNDIILSYFTDEIDVEGYLDDLQIINISSGIILSNLSEGSHNLTMVAQDEVQNSIIITTIFTVDTIPPSLVIMSPFNQSYTGIIDLEIQSNGTTILYNIPGIHAFNQTYSSSVVLNLPLGNYVLNAYAYDNAGNFKAINVEFSIVMAIELLLNPDLETIDAAGNYLIKTQILNHPSFESVGLVINGTPSGFLVWSSFYFDYRLNFQLPSPGNWQVTLYAKTTSEEYDFHYFNISWVPPPPIFESISVTWTSTYYELITKIDSGSLSIETVNVSIAGNEYSLTYEFFGDRWVGNLPFSPLNGSFQFTLWYPWDVVPSVIKEYNVNWFAPTILQTRFESTRENFTLKVRIERQNASIDSSSISLIVSNGSLQFNIPGTLDYESLSGSYQEWSFSSPNLPLEEWYYSLYARDIYGISSIMNGVFNAIDLPPFFPDDPLINEKQYYSDRIQYRIEIAAADDYYVDRVILFVDGIPVNSISQNLTHFVFEVFLIQGFHTLRVVAYDDIDQENISILGSIEVNIPEDNQNTSTPENSQSSIPISSSKNDEPTLGEIFNEDIIELGLAGSIFTVLITVGNVVRRKRGI